MNERIKELAEQAGFMGYGEESGTYSIPVKAFESRMETVAELIVRECARVASDYDGAHYVGTAIENHFGVEE
jgi:hypothetical protein